MQAHDGATTLRRQIRATGQHMLWTFAWVATLAAARFGPGLLWDAQQQPLASWTAVVLNVLAGIAWIVTFARYLRTLDDLQRKIMLDALAVTLGVGWVVGFAWSVAEAAGLVAYGPSIALFAVFLTIAYLSTLAIGWIRFR